MVVVLFISLTLLLALIARITVRTLHYFEIVFAVTVSIFLYFCYFGIASFNYGVFSASAQLGSFSCLLIMGFVTVPSVVLTAASLGFWRNSLLWKTLVGLGSLAMQLGMEALAVKGGAIIYHDWSMLSSFAAWIVYLAVLHFLVQTYRNFIRVEVRLP